MTTDFIRNAYKVLLLRELEERQVEPIMSMRVRPEDLVASILSSEEFLQGPVAKHAEWGDPRTLRHKSLDKLCALFTRYEGPGTAGFYTDFLGVKTRLHYIPNVQQYDGAVLDYPSREQQPLHAFAAFGGGDFRGVKRKMLAARARRSLPICGGGRSCLDNQ